MFAFSIRTYSITFNMPFVSFVWLREIYHITRSYIVVLYWRSLLHTIINIRRLVVPFFFKDAFTNQRKTLRSIQTCGRTVCRIFHSYRIQQKHNAVQLLNDVVAIMCIWIGSISHTHLCGANYRWLFDINDRNRLVEILCAAVRKGYFI